MLDCLFFLRWNNPDDRSACEIIGLHQYVNLPMQQEVLYNLRVSSKLKSNAKNV